MDSVDRHFSTIAENYRKLRSTESAPICSIHNRLKKYNKIIAADVGCGCGRYSLKLFKYFGSRLFLYCVDCNKAMLEQLKYYFQRHRVKNFRIKQTYARDIPISSNSLDCIFTFNAIHHFRIFNFFKEAKRILKKGGILFIYTRTRSQNKKNIWGMYFPRFVENETRLYEADELKKIIAMIPGFEVMDVEYFQFKKSSNLAELLELTNQRHYSTFSLYSDKEFRESIVNFERNIMEHFDDLNNITWFNENIMFVIRNNMN